MIENSVLEKLEFPKVLNHISTYATTEPGKNLILQLIPLTDKILIETEGVLVTEAKEIIIKSDNPPIEFIPDLDRSLSESKIEGVILNSKKILEILKLAKTGRLLFQFLKKNYDSELKIAGTTKELFVDKVFEHQIEKIISEQGEINENASRQLVEIRKDIRNKKDDLVKSINSIIKKLKEGDIVREDYLTLRDGRMVIPIKAEHKRHLRGFIHSESSTGQTVYIEPEETLELNNDIVSLSFAEKREIERLLKELTKMIGEVSEKLKCSLAAIAYIDSIFARAKYSFEVIGSFPQIDNLKPIQISDARHPLLLKKLGKSVTVPLNFKLESDKVVIITGPNAGGKTVVLKTLGILNLMLQSGIHIPVSPDSNFHIFKNILIDIGDEQSIEDDLSTFSSHLKNLKAIIENADGQSLVLLDEIGTGTDPAEGSALAASILKILLKKMSIVFASTHHGSLKLIAYQIMGMQNAAMQFDHKTLSPTYSFELGVPGSSYAFEIAKRIGLSDEILDEAKKNLDPDKHQLENFLSEIESKSGELSNKLKELEIENTRLHGLSNLYKKSYDKIEQEKKEILKKVKIDAEDYLQDINRKIEKVIKDLRDSNASKEIIKETRSLVEELKINNQKLIEEEQKVENLNKDFNPGDFVSLKYSSAVSKILDINREKGRASILSGAIKMDVKIEDLIPAIEKKEVVSDKIYSSFKPAEISYRLDIRGEKPEAAEFEIIRFIDDAYQTGLERVEILHGKGTGVLKKTVADILKKHGRVKSFYFAPIEQGGEGITIAEIE